MAQWVKNLPATQETQRHRFDPWVRKIPGRRAWQPTPVFLPEESHGQRSLTGCKESDVTDATEHSTQRVSSTGNAREMDRGGDGEAVIAAGSGHVAVCCPGSGALKDETEGSLSPRPKPLPSEPRHPPPSLHRPSTQCLGLHLPMRSGSPQAQEFKPTAPSLDLSQEGHAEPPSPGSTGDAWGGREMQLTHTHSHTHSGESL